jgi:hypothetical protein
VYATVADLRGEGVPVEAVDDTRAALLLEEASRLIDQVTGQWFTPQARTLRVPGRGAPSVYPSVPPIALEAITDFEENVPLTTVEIVGAPVDPGTDEPRITRLRGCFRLGRANVRLVGWFGYTEADGTAFGRTPLAIRRATLLLAYRWVVPIGLGDGVAGRRIIEERTREQSVRFAEPASGGELTDQPEVDVLLAPYVRRRRVGVA